MSIFTFGIPKTPQQPPVFSWRPFIVLGVMLLAALGLRVYQWFTGPVVPPVQVPSLSWEEMQSDALEGDVHEDVLGEVEGGTEGGDAQPTPVVPEVPAFADGGVVVGGEDSTDTGSDASAALPVAVNLAVPFTSQAPLGIWDAFTEETCEEASFLMALSYYEGKPEGTLLASDVDATLRAMMDVETGLGFGPSISTSQFALFAQTYNGTAVRVLENPTVDDLRAELAAGNPVLVPAYGRELGNPFFTGEGPLYHMLVLRGYTQTSFITNDPGTRHGENYQYAFDVLLQAIGDWDGDSPDGGAHVIVLEK